MRKIFMMVLMGVLALPSSALSREKSVIIDATGVDGIKVGMTQKELDRLRLKIDYDRNDDCTQGSLKSAGLLFLLEKGRVTRIYATKPRYRTVKGIGVGSTKNEAISAYGKALKIERHKYDERGHYLSLIDKNGKGFVFEAISNIITEVSIGVLPALHYVEKCH